MPRTSDARERIVTTAARLFLERSYQAVGVDELCQAADVRKGSFYHYFPSKSELAKAVIDLHAEVFARRLSGSPAATPAQKLHAIPDAIGVIQTALEAQFGRAVGCPFGNFAAELSTTDDDLRTHLAGVLGAMERHLAAACRDAAAAGCCGTAPTRTASPTHCWRSIKASSCSPSSTTPGLMRSRPRCTTSSTAISSS